MRPQITVVDPWHWLTESGGFPPDPRLRSRMLRVAQCIEAGGPLPAGHTRETLIPCRRRPGKKACTGLLWVIKEPSGAIHAFCPTCRSDEFLIHNWEETDWAEGPMEPARIDEVFEIPGAPQQLHHQSQAAHDMLEIGGDGPCPCRSGKSYERCCGLH